MAEVPVKVFVRVSICMLKIMVYYVESEKLFTIRWYMIQSKFPNDRLVIIILKIIYEAALIKEAFV